MVFIWVSLKKERGERETWSEWCSHLSGWGRAENNVKTQKKKRGDFRQFRRVFICHASGGVETYGKRGFG